MTMQNEDALLFLDLFVLEMSDDTSQTLFFETHHICQLLNFFKSKVNEVCLHFTDHPVIVKAIGVSVTLTVMSR